MPGSEIETPDGTIISTETAAVCFPPRSIGTYPSETDLVEAGRMFLQALDVLGVGLGEQAIIRPYSEA